MFCPQCGSPLEESCAFCPNCGAPVDRVSAPQPAPAPASAPVFCGTPVPPPAPRSKKKRWIPFAAVGTGVLLLVVLLLLCLPGGKTAPIRHYMKAVERNSVSEFEAAFPEEVLESNEFGKNYLESVYSELCDAYGEDFSIDYKILKDSRLDDDELETLAEQCSQAYDMEKSEFTDAYTIEVSVTVSGEKDSTTNTSSVTVFKYSGHWYLSPN